MPHKLLTYFDNRFERPPLKKYEQGPLSRFRVKQDATVPELLKTLPKPSKHMVRNGALSIKKSWKNRQGN